MLMAQVLEVVTWDEELLHLGNPQTYLVEDGFVKHASFLFSFGSVLDFGAASV